MRVRRLVVGLLLLILCISNAHPLWAWGKGID